MATSAVRYEHYEAAAAYIRAQLPGSPPKIAIVCGTGLGGIVGTLDKSSTTTEIAYADIPHFPRPTVLGHAGKMVFGHMSLSKIPVMVLVGRVHFYEGHAMDMVSFATRVCRLLDVQTMIVTNAAGGLNPDYAVGDIVVLNDHISMAGLAGFNPLRGANVEQLGTRFPTLSDAYDLDLRQRVHKAWKTLQHGDSKRRLHEGVYAFASGPTFETRAECRMFHKLGADVVGMSTVPEIIVARHAGMRVLAMSLVTNAAVLQPVARGDDESLYGLTPDEMQKRLAAGAATHEEVLIAGKEAAATFEQLVERVVADLQ